MVEHHFGRAAGFQDAVHLADGLGCVRRVMQHAVGVDDIKALVSERQDARRR